VRCQACVVEVGRSSRKFLLMAYAHIIIICTAMHSYALPSVCSDDAHREATRAREKKKDPPGLGSLKPELTLVSTRVANEIWALAGKAAATSAVSSVSASRFAAACMQDHNSLTTMDGSQPTCGCHRD
jgi:hypothetical protein